MKSFTLAAVASIALAADLAADSQDKHFFNWFNDDDCGCEESTTSTSIQPSTSSNSSVPVTTHSTSSSSSSGFTTPVNTTTPHTKAPESAVVTSTSATTGCSGKNGTCEQVPSSTAPVSANGAIAIGGTLAAAVIACLF